MRFHAPIRPMLCIMRRAPESPAPHRAVHARITVACAMRFQELIRPMLCIVRRVLERPAPHAPTRCMRNALPSDRPPDAMHRAPCAQASSATLAFPRPQHRCVRIALPSAISHWMTPSPSYLAYFPKWGNLRDYFITLWDYFRGSSLAKGFWACRTPARPC